MKNALRGVFRTLENLMAEPSEYLAQRQGQMYVTMGVPI